MRRAIAYRLSLRAFLNKEFVKGSTEQASYAKLTPKLNVSRVNVWGNVMRKYVSENDFGSLTIDDFSATVNANVFKENMALIDSIKPGDVVSVIGKLREGKDGIYISAETIGKITPEEELLKRLDNLKTMKEISSLEDSVTEDLQGSEGFSVQIEKNVIAE